MAKRAWPFLLSALLATAVAVPASAECEPRGIWYKEVYCTGGSAPDYLPPIIEELPSVDEQVSSLLAIADQHMKEGNTLAAWTEIDTALRLKPGDANTLALQASLNQILAEVQRKSDEQLQQAQIRSLQDQARQLADSGRLDEAMEAIRKAKDRSPFDATTSSIMADIKTRIEAPAIFKRRAEEAKRREDYQTALAQAQTQTRKALNELAARLQGPMWQRLETAVAVSTEAASVEPGDAAGMLQIPFDRIEGLVSGSALERLLGGPAAVPVSPKNETELMRRLVDQLDYWEGQRRELQEALTAEPDLAKREAIKINVDIIEGIKATARVKLIDLSVSTRE